VHNHSDYYEFEITMLASDFPFDGFSKGKRRQ